MSPRNAAAVTLSVAFALAGVACTPRKPPTASAPTQLDTSALAARRGQQLAVLSCAGCHAIGSAAASQMAEATPFRMIVQRYPLDQLEEALAEGLVTGHPAMPPFVFRASEIDDLIAYLETVKVEP